MDEALIILFIGCVGVVAFAILLNPKFWQGFRNAKFIDMLQEEEREQRLHAADAEDTDRGTGKEIQNVF